MSIVRPLSAAECPLAQHLPEAATKQLLELFNSCVTRVDEVGRDMSSFINRDDLSGLMHTLHRLRDGLTRERYRVGFLGTSSAGKSTIFNKVLKEEIAKSGSGDATTSLPSRLFRSPEGGANSCQLVYLTPEQYLSRRKRLAQAIGIGTPPAPNAELLTLLKEPQSFRASDGGSSKPFLEHDLHYLTAFLHSYDQFGRTLVKAPVAAETVAFDARADFINHSSKGGHNDASKNLLMAEARIQITNPNLPNNLEMCDLPGLNSKRTVDNLITEDFLQELDGAFVFVNVAENFFNASVSEILLRLKAKFGDDLSGRVWVVFNKCDSLSRAHYQPPANSNSVFDNIARFLKENQVPVSQICFTSAALNNLADATTGKADIFGVVLTLRAISETHTIEEPIPANCPADFRPVYQSFLDDGGILRLRELIQHQVGKSVAAKMRADAEAELERFLSEFNRRVEIERRRTKGGRQMAGQALMCRNEIITLREALGGRSHEFPLMSELATFLREKLHAALFPDPNYHRILEKMSLAELRHEFQIHSTRLEETLHDVLTGDVIDKFYAEIAGRLEKLPPVEIGTQPGGCQGAWQVFRAADRRVEVWQNALFPTFQSTEFFDTLNANRNFDALSGRHYLDLLDEKIQTCVYQTMHSIRTRLRFRLRELERELNLLIIQPTAGVAVGAAS
ncbi:P-loop NTPase family protein [Tuwongella immobilis]|uniref:: Dynamin_N n=1 Tax=Tuwongella immobilis TaxID=692036 RepID=A0A6C2YJP6_9BACT|nr:dynamin family protein [Tuwongella immobilis]VIP01335.1 : Dynamin_N [Tuwongella immobilis]VTR98098.1 : Dynamin_N [Tuwongella immobilis]